MCLFDRSAKMGKRKCPPMKLETQFQSLCTVPRSTERSNGVFDVSKLFPRDAIYLMSDHRAESSAPLRKRQRMSETPSTSCVSLLPVSQILPKKIWSLYYNGSLFSIMARSSEHSWEKCLVSTSFQSLCERLF